MKNQNLWTILSPQLLYLVFAALVSFIGPVNGAVVGEISDGTTTSTAVIEVELGDMAVLDCPSNDDDHRFQFWMLNTKDYIGPGSRSVEKEKIYKYEVLTGKLYIRSVSTEQHGVYTCFCRHLTKTTYNVKSVELIVKRNWEDVYENDSSTNMFRVAILFTVVITLFVILGVLYHLQKQRTALLFREMMDEESVDDDKPHTSFQRMVNSTNTIDTQGMDGLDNQSLDTELPKEFQTQVLISNQ